MAEIFIPTLHTFENNNIFTGSCGSLRFRIEPQVVMAPRQAWNCPVEAVPFTEARGRIAAENVTFYPPGIPVLTLGEEITAACQDYIRQKMAHGYKPNGPADGTLATIRVLKEEFHER